MKHFLLLNRPQHKVAAELLPTVGPKSRIQFYHWLLAGLLLLLPGLLQAQTYPDALTLSTQEEVNKFNYTEVTGDLTIQGADITDLTPLASLTKVGGHIYIINNSSLSSLAGLENLTSMVGHLYIDRNSSLNSLAGLENLTSVGGVFYITNNSSLSSLAGLENLTSVAGFFLITNNSSLSSMAGLENLTLVGGDLLIIDNSSLSSLAGLKNLTSVVRLLNISNNSSLSSLAGLEKLTSVGTSGVDFLNISNNSSLSSLAGLKNLTSVAGQIFIENNSSLRSLMGLEKLTSVGESFYIRNNSSLTSLAGLENLTSVRRDLTITNNVQLSQCCQLVSVIKATKGIVTISGNAANCNSVAEIKASCEPKVCDGDVTLTTQEEVNAFNCSEVTGNLTIRGADITNLTPLASLTKVGGYINISGNANLSSLVGLENLTSVAGELYIDNNSRLSSLTGLENLNSVGGELYIANNSSLSSLAGLENLNSVGYLMIRNNSSLSSLAGLKNLTSVAKSLTITNNVQLSQCCLLLSVIEAAKGIVNISGNATGCESRAAIAAACVPVIITAQPQPAAACIGKTATFKVEATGSGLSYQWLKNGQAITGATASTYEITAVTATDAAAYSVEVSKGGEKTSSDIATLTVNPLPTPAITSIPTSNVYTGGNPTIIYLGYGAQSVKLQASGGVTYSWNPATGLSNAAIAELVFTPTTAGTYTFTVTATSSSGCTASKAITITVIDARYSNKKNQVLICHDGKTNNIDVTSVPNHLAHGDKLGSCGSIIPAIASSRSYAVETEVAVQTILKAYPNPFSGQTTIEFSLAQDEEYTLAIYDLKGTLVKQLPNGKAKANELKQVAWQVGNAAAGLYIVRLTTATNVQQLKLMVE